MGREEIRKPAVAGSFYPQKPEILRKEVADLLDKAQKEVIDGEIVALVSPHAGYIYSGQVAAFAYKLVEGMSFEGVIVIAPSHRAYFRGVSLYGKGGYQTPLGIIPIDADLSRKIKEGSEIIEFSPQFHLQEHSLEVQLPFLQIALKEFKLVPLLMGQQDLETSKRLSESIAQSIKGRKVLIVASSDLSHYYPYDEAVRLDKNVLKHLSQFDPISLQEDLDRRGCEACGGGPMVTAMLGAQKLGASRAKVLKYMNSGDVTGERGEVVGYVAAVFYSKGRKND